MLGINEDILSPKSLDNFLTADHLPLRIVQGDMKPANIRITKRGMPRSYTWVGEG